MHRPLVALLVLLMAASAQAQNGTDEGTGGDPTDVTGGNETVAPQVDPWLAQRSTQVGISLVAAAILLVAFVQVARK